MRDEATEIGTETIIEAVTDDGLGPRIIDAENQRWTRIPQAVTIEQEKERTVTVEVVTIEDGTEIEVGMTAVWAEEM